MKTSKILLLLLGIIASNLIVAQKANYKWLDTNLTVDERVEALVNELSLDEKVNQLLYNAKGIERLGILPYNWWNECLHGVARNGRATVFPQAICLGATFDDDLAYRVATAISDEARTKFVISQNMNNYAQYAGLTFWSPNINIFRDPRWGRGQETYGEDPYLTSRMGVNFIKGIQGDNPKFLKAAACAKHYAVHSGPEELRHEFDALCSPKDLWETYLPAFEAAVVEANVEAVMGAYNRVNGEAACASPTLLKDILRDKWGFKGHVVSDCWAIQDIYAHHKMVKTPEEAAAMAIKNGLQLNCGVTFNSLKKAIEKNLCTEEDVNKALRILLRTKFKLGLHNPPKTNPYYSEDESVISNEKHASLALEVAQKGMVLLKNKDNVLPLKKNIKTLYVTGPHAASADVLMGNYYGVSGNTVNFLDGIAAKVSSGTTINYKYGQLPYRKNENPIDWTTGEAGSADACIAVMGISGLYEGEEGESIASDFKGDKKHIRLPQAQIEFLKKIRSKGDKPLIVVITSGSAIALPEIYDIADAVIYAWYPGQEGGSALANIIFGDASPSGKLPFTVPYTVDDLPPYDDYAMKGRTYRYMEKEPQFTFGFGLTYADFSFENLKLQTDVVKKGKELAFDVEIKNKSAIDAEEVIQVYLAQNLGLEDQPLSSLKAFKRIKVKANSNEKLSLTLPYEDLKLIDEDGEKKIFKGKYKLIIGNASPSERTKKLGGKFIEAEFTLK